MFRKLVGRLLLSGVICLATGAYALAMEYKEAPELRVKVAAGELLPVEKRLPEEPLVVKPVEEIGQYGGTWRQLHMGPVDKSQMGYLVSEHLVRYSPDFTDVLPNVVKSWEISKDAKSITFFLRKGMKWSDGASFTADDFMFWWDDIILNDELTPVKPALFKIGGELGVFKKLDDYTIRWSFVNPYGIFLESIAGWFTPIMYAPKHYLKRFHPKYMPMDEIKETMEAEGFDSWIDLFSAKNDWGFNNPECPQICAWIPQNMIDKPIQIWVRNPYYWKVDTEGNQLPYVDGIHRILLSDTQTILLKAIAGEADFTYRRVQGFENYTIVMENREKGDYRVIPLFSMGVNQAAILINFHHKDPVLRKLFCDLRFRIALSVAIDREEINELIWKGQGFISQVAPGPGTPGYEERFAKMYTELNPKRANQLLDEIGLTKRDEKGYRLRPDGKRLRFVISVFTPWPPEAVEMMELCKGYWEEIGIETVVKPTDRALWITRVQAAEHDIAVYSAGVGGWPGFLSVGVPTFPLDMGFYAAPMWALWFASGGTEGEEPPVEMKRLMELYGEILSSPSVEKRIELMKEVFTNHVENLWMIGTIAEPPIMRFGVAKNNFRNIPKGTLCGDLTIYHPATWFFEQ
ncbi:ABC transporter substrate-binding protein [Patescibacteria group bacterium]|nr:ABC transporter substrate-binding protein [Patescibacteria group bacterium]